MIPLPEGPFGCILADPPWHHKSRSPKGQGRRSPSHHYPTMPLADIKALPVGDIAAPNCHLFLWTTGPHLEQAFSVMKAWGFSYSSDVFVWVKLNPRQGDAMLYDDGSFAVGMGYTSRKNTEYVLLGRKGRPVRMAKDVRQLIVSPRRQHSRKPEEARRRIERYVGDVPKVELFAREAAPGWVAWGNETEKFNGVE